MLILGDLSMLLQSDIFYPLGYACAGRLACNSVSLNWVYLCTSGAAVRQARMGSLAELPCGWACSLLVHCGQEGSQSTSLSNFKCELMILYCDFDSIGSRSPAHCFDRGTSGKLRSLDQGAVLIG